MHARGLELRASRLTGVALDGAQLARPEWRDCELHRCSLANTLVRGGSLTRVTFTDCRMTGVTWAQTTLEDVTFRGCLLDLASFHAARLRRVIALDCVMREAELAEAVCDSVRFDRCDLTGANFRGARFAAGELRGCTLDAITGIEGLRGASIPWPELVGLAGTLASALGIGVLEEG